MDSGLVKGYLLGLQARIVDALASLDGMPFRRDEWQRPEGGGGISRLVEEGNLFERGGVNFSHVTGKQLPPSASAHRPELAGRAWEAMGVSLVLHPRNPYVPTTHMNVRMFVATKEGEAPVFWFGGGMDMTPYYPFADDAQHFHRTCKAALDPFGADYYPRFKKWCDEYFYLKHRQEPRGIGGVFYDYLRPADEEDAERLFHFQEANGNSFLQSYLPIIEKRKNTNYSEREIKWQEIRRGRYVEFNLIHDRGTIFGLKTNGRTESILMSLPPRARWEYDYHPAPGSEEEKLQDACLHPKEWI